MHEAKMHAKNCFVTLTYREAPASLVYRDFQLFMKRLRKSVGVVRFYMAGEYGEESGRPHFHACLFGYQPSDLEYLGKSPGGARLYRSARLEALWPLGYVAVGEVTFESAAYVARYVMKKITGDAAAGHYGERVPEFGRMSLRPGIGRGWFDSYGRSDVLPDGRVVVNGRKASAPRYYRRLMRERFPMTYRKVQMVDEAKARESIADSDNSRLEAKERVAMARLSFSKRNL